MKRRRSWLHRSALVLLPALVVAITGLFASSLPLRATLAATQQERGIVTGGLPNAATVQQVQARVGALRAELTAANAARQPTVRDAAAPTVPASARAEWRLQLSAILARHSLHLLGEERIDVDLPKVVARGLGGENAPMRWPAWSLRLTGSYLDVLAAIDALQKALLPCHVLDLEMRRDPTGALVWNLVVA